MREHSMFRRLQSGSTAWNVGPEEEVERVYAVGIKSVFFLSVRLPYLCHMHYEDDPKIVNAFTLQLLPTPGAQSLCWLPCWQLAGESKPAYHVHARHPKATGGVCSAAVAATGTVSSFTECGHSWDVGMEGVLLLCNNGICDLGCFLMGAS